MSVLKHQWRVTAWAEGIGDIGLFDQSSGGMGDSEEKKYREGGQIDESVLGGARSRSNVTIERLWRAERDGPIFKRLDAGRGKIQLIITKTPCDADLNPIVLPGVSPLIYRGKVKAVTGPDTDSSDSSGETKLVIEQSTAGPIG
jgi:hypothetical protein